MGELHDILPAYNFSYSEFNNNISSIKNKDLNLNNTFNWLDKIKTIQGELDQEIIVSNRKKRSQKLVNEIKEHYKYCQICSDEPDASILERSVPKIIKEEGVIYIEVHHIMPVSKSKVIGKKTQNVKIVNTDMEEKMILDYYDNVIVVCPFHHKLLHHHDGGFNLHKDENGLVFVSKNGTSIRIARDDHLSQSNKYTLIKNV